MADDNAPVANHAPLLWALAFVVAMFGTGFGARFAGLDGIWTMIVMLPPMLLLIPLIRSTERSGNLAGCTSPALKRYNRRGLLCSFSYVAALFFAVSVNDWPKPELTQLWLTPVIPPSPTI